jgi:hypothetical protein
MTLVHHGIVATGLALATRFNGLLDGPCRE